MKKTTNLFPKKTDELSFSEYEKSDKSNIERVEIILSDPLDFKNFGSVKVTYKDSIWEKYG